MHWWPMCVDRFDSRSESFTFVLRISTAQSNRNPASLHAWIKSLSSEPNFSPYIFGENPRPVLGEKFLTTQCWKMMWNPANSSSEKMEIFLPACLDDPPTYLTRNYHQKLRASERVKIRRKFWILAWRLELRVLLFALEGKLMLPEGKLVSLNCHEMAQPIVKTGTVSSCWGTQIVIRRNKWIVMKSSTK